MSLWISCGVVAFGLLIVLMNNVSAVPMCAVGVFAAAIEKQRGNLPPTRFKSFLELLLQMVNDLDNQISAVHHDAAEYLINIRLQTPKNSAY
jgi:F0F1-type ATP synthase membrane subunit a